MSLIKRQRAGRILRQHHLRCECLESRDLLTTFTVNSGLDVVDDTDGVTTLREAVGQANAEVGPDTIVFDPNTPTQFEEIAVFLESEIDITDDLTIQGLNQFDFVIVGNQGATDISGDGDRVFNINDGSPNVINVRISDMTIQGGDTGGNGGAILSEESLTIERVAAVANNAETSGGFLFASIPTGVSVVVDDSRISSNAAAGEGGGVAAAVYGGSLEIKNSTITGNVATDGGGVYIYGDAPSNDITLSNNDVIANDAERGGGVSFIGASGSAEIVDSLVSENTSRDGGGIAANLDTAAALSIRDTIVSNNVSEAHGGIHAELKGDLTIQNSRISGNSTTDGDDGPGEGVGGVGVEFTGEDADVRIDSSVIAFNSSSDAGGIWVDFGGNQNSALTVLSSTVSGNTASRAAAIGVSQAGVLAIQHSTVVNNENSVEGEPAVFADATMVTIHHSIIADHAVDLGASTGAFDASYSLIGTNAGSGLAAAPVGSPDANGNIIGGASAIDPMLSALGTNGGLSDTHALMPGSPAIDAGDQNIVSPPSFDQRGNPFLRQFDGDSDGTATIDIGAYERVVSGLVVSTIADGFDGDYSDGNLSLREAIQLAADSVSTSGTVTFSPTLNGQTIELSEGQISIVNPVTINGPGAADLTVSAVGNDPTPDTKQGDGSRVFEIDDNDDSRGLAVEISGLTLTGGDVTGAGGAIQSREHLTLRDATITGNHAAQSDEQVGFEGDGGGVWAQTFTGNILFDNVSVTENTSDDDGGGLNVLAGEGTVRILNSTVSNNTANGLGVLGPNLGGGIRASANPGGEVSVVNSTISDNVGQRMGTGDNWGGGGVGFLGSGKLTVRSSTISGNTSDALGGGIYMEGSYVDDVGSVGEFEITDSIISDNDASLGAGVGILLNGAGTIENTTIDGNDASDGGGIFNIGKLDVVSSTISGNTAGFGGGILNGYLTLDSTFAGELDILNSTISGNESEFGGGLFTVIQPSTVSTIRHSTIVNNVADVNRDDEGTGGGVYAFYGRLDIDHTIIAQNTVSLGGAPDMQLDPDGVNGATAVIEFTNSLLGDNTGIEIAESIRFNDTWLQADDGNYVGGPTGGIIDPMIGDLADNGGPTKTHALLDGSLAIDAGDDGDLDPPDSDQRGAPFVRIDGALDFGAFEEQPEPSADGDFDGDGDFDCADIDALVVHIRDGGSDAQFDVDGDGVVSETDVAAWRTAAGNANQGRPYLSGDANLNGVTDAQDLNVLGQVWLQNVSGWCAGDLNGDGVVDAIDLNRVGQSWGQGGAAAATARAPQAALAAQAASIDEAFAGTSPIDGSRLHRTSISSNDILVVGDAMELRSEELRPEELRTEELRTEGRSRRYQMQSQRRSDVVHESAAGPSEFAVVDQLLGEWAV